MRVIWTTLALGDLQQISLHLEHRHSLSQANRVCRVIYRAVQQLKTQPYIGRVGERSGTRELVVTSLPYIVVYRVEDRSV